MLLASITTVLGVGAERKHSVGVTVLDVELPDHALHVSHLGIHYYPS